MIMLCTCGRPRPRPYCGPAAPAADRRPPRRRDSGRSSDSATVSYRDNWPGRPGVKHELRRAKQRGHRQWRHGSCRVAASQDSPGWRPANLRSRQHPAGPGELGPGRARRRGGGPEISSHGASRPVSDPGAPPSGRENHWKKKKETTKPVRVTAPRSPASLRATRTPKDNSDPAPSGPGPSGPAIRRSAQDSQLPEQVGCRGDGPIIRRCRPAGASATAPRRRGAAGATGGP
jgi:hypothetical protein